MTNIDFISRLVTLRVQAGILKNLLNTLGPDVPQVTKQDLENKLKIIMADIDTILQDVTDESSIIDGITTLIAGLQQQVKDALANGGADPTLTAKIAKILTLSDANKTKLAAALASGTPVAPPVLTFAVGDTVPAGTVVPVGLIVKDTSTGDVIAPGSTVPTTGSYTVQAS